MYVFWSFYCIEKSQWSSTHIFGTWVLVKLKFLAFFTVFPSEKNLEFPLKTSQNFINSM